MTIAFIIALVIAVFFIILWSEERGKLENAEQKIRQLAKENKKLKSKGGQAVSEKSRKSKGFAIPKPVKKEEPPVLDHGKLAKLQEQTRAAQEMLAEIFIQEDETVHQTSVNSDKTFLIGILEKLLTKEIWTRGEVADLAGPDAMIGNLLEQINDYAYPIVNDVVVEEDGDNIYVTTEYKEQLT